jgi:hypothetical protein
MSTVFKDLTCTFSVYVAKSSLERKCLELKVLVACIFDTYVLSCAQFAVY